ncbi:MAG: D-2-hydroxyacid dehydrogenase [Vicinamibacterales bacterium]
MRVVISLRHHVVQWQFPPAAVHDLARAFPDVTFVHTMDEAERAAALPGADVVFTWKLTPAELAAAPRLGWAHTSAVAVETFCLPELFARGVRLTNTRGVQAVPIAEHVLGVVLAFARQLPLVLDAQREARWAQSEHAGARMPWLVRGRTLGLIGLGTIGTAIAGRARALGMRVIATRRRADAERPAALDEVLPPAGLPDLLARADVVVIAAPLTPDTLGLIGAAELAAMKPGAILVNVGRAKIVDTDALVAALRSGHLGGAALDVFPKEPLPADHPLWTCPNVILTPHTAGFRDGHWDEVIALFADNLRRYRSGEPLLHEVQPALGY